MATLRLVEQCYQENRQGGLPEYEPDSTLAHSLTDIIKHALDVILTSYTHLIYIRPVMPAL